MNMEVISFVTHPEKCCVSKHHGQRVQIGCGTNNIWQGICYGKKTPILGRYARFQDAVKAGGQAEF